MPIDNLNGYQTRDGDSELLRQLLAGPAGTRGYPVDWSIASVSRPRPAARAPQLPPPLTPSPMGGLDLQVDYARTK